MCVCVWAVSRLVDTDTTKSGFKLSEERNEMRSHQLPVQLLAALNVRVFMETLDMKLHLKLFL